MFVDVYERFAPVLEEFEDEDTGNEEDGAQDGEAEDSEKPSDPAALEPAPAAPSELTPLIVAMDFMIQDSKPEGSGLEIKPEDHPALSAEEFDAMTDKINKAVKMLRVVEAHNPCLFRAIKLMSRIA